MKKLSYSIIALLLSAGIVCFAVKFTAGQTADAEVPKVEKKSPVGTCQHRQESAPAGEVAARGG